MLVVISKTRVINLDNVKRVTITPPERAYTYLKFDSESAECTSYEDATATLKAIADAYSRGDKIFYMNKE